MGSSCSISVTFTPASATSFSAILTVADNASGSPQTVTLSGTGTTPPPAPVAALAPTSLTFSAVNGTMSAAQSTTLTNTGNAVLNISGISVTGTNAADFGQTNTCESPLAVGSSCTVSVTFTPASVATFSAALSVADDASGSPQTVALSGTGTPAPTFTITSNTTAQTIKAGGTAQYSIIVAAQNGTFSNPVTLSVGGLPPGATGAFSPAMVTPGSSSATSQLTIQTASTTAAMAGSGTGWPLALATLPFVGLFLAIGKRRRRWITFAVLLLASLGAVSAITGCEGGFSFAHKSQSYSVTITGTSGAEQQSTVVQLTVQ